MKDWYLRGACRGYPNEWWFPTFERGGIGYDNHPETQRAIAICRSCPVIEQCREYAVPRASIEGIWAGTTPKARERLRSMAVREGTPMT